MSSNRNKIFKDLLILLKNNNKDGIQRRKYITNLPSNTIPESKFKPLDGIRVLELGQLIAGPFCGTILGYYGAEVIKVEPPKTGDPLRVWRHLDIDGVSPWFRSMGRNKKSCEINLRTDDGRKLVRKLADSSDILIENFRPGTMEKWNLGPDELSKTNPSLIYTRVSGYGQTGPYALKPGYASVCEAMAGFRHINGFPNQPPVRPNISLGDSVAGLTAALGSVMGLLARDKIKSNTVDTMMITGQVIDVAIYESMFNMMEGILPEYDRFGEIRQPSGTTVTGIVPTNAYQCSDSKYVIIGGNGDSIYKRLMEAAGRIDLTGEKYATNKQRVKHQQLIDDAINNWTKTLTSKQVIESLEQVGVPCGGIYNIKDIVNDEHVKERELLEVVKVGGNNSDNGWNLKIPAITPKLTSTPGKTNWAGPDLGQHNKEIFVNVLKLSEQEIIKLQESQIIGKTL
ncbi:14049_t:CDS:10 [Entrophospora sp. SA101]|nr:14049_t:CDS:10 [Entrophospora sp. SA101]CAJ0904398.1 6592_t:CDS:10 [Entrophospora sp. SA101]